MAERDLETRVTALETQVHELATRVRRSEQDAAAARVLAGGADRDVNEIRGELRDFRQATTSSFNALREDMHDLRDDMHDLREDLTGLRTHVDERFAQVDRGFMEMRGRLDAAATGQQQIVDMLTTLIDQQQGEQSGNQ